MNAPATEPIGSLRIGATVFVAATVAGLLFTAQEAAHLIARDRDVDLIATAVRQFAPWYAWAALLPSLLRFSQRHLVTRAPWYRSLLRYGVAGVCLAIAHSLLTALPLLWVTGFFGSGDPLRVGIQIVVANILLTSFIQYWLVAALIQSGLLYRDVQSREAAAERLRAQLAEAELRMLRNQLHPHFLFNTLNAIAADVRDAPAAAETMLLRLSELLRLLLETSSSELVPLEREVDIARRFIELHQLRFGGRLTAAIHMPDSLARVRVPAMTLQPLVENAIKHGVERRRGPAWLSVEASEAGDSVFLTVADGGDAPAQPLPHGSSTGIGLENLRQRLQYSFGAAANLDMDASPMRSEARVRIPRSAAAVLPAAIGAAAS